MLTLLEDLGRRVSDALRTAYPDAAATLPAVIAPEPSDKADLATAAAMQFARTLKRPPREVAEKIVAALDGHPALAGAPTIAGPGFVNLSLSDAWLGAHASDALALRSVGQGQTVVIDFSSPNVAKPMHIGHIRSTILGDALQRVFRALGYTVIADNHIGDWGTQFGKLIVAWRRWLDPVAFEHDAVGELLRLYVKFVEEERKEKAALGQRVTDGEEGDDAGEVRDDAPALLREARAELVKLQQGDAENVALWKRFIDVSMREFDRTYRRLGVTFDVVHGESFYNDRLAATVDLLLSRGIAEIDAGAVLVRFEKARDGEALPPCLVRKADGGFLYATSDIAAVLYRDETWRPTRSIYVTDERQQLHFRQFFAVARRLGTTTQLDHVWFGLMRLPEGTISTRDGKLISLEALLDEAEKRALDVARTCSPDLGEEGHRAVARAVGLGAVKYNDLSKDRQTLVTFTWDKALALTGNTAPYLQYAYARIRSILRKAGEQGLLPGDAVVIGEPSERALVMQLLRFPGVVEEVARTCRPHVLCEYLFTLSTAFSSFYDAAPVLKAEPAVRASRLRLADTVSQVLARGLGLLGIDVLERM